MVNNIFIYTYIFLTTFDKIPFCFNIKQGFVENKEHFLLFTVLIIEVNSTVLTALLVEFAHMKKVYNTVLSK